MLGITGTTAVASRLVLLFLIAGFVAATRFLLTTEYAQYLGAKTATFTGRFVLWFWITGTATVASRFELLFRIAGFAAAAARFFLTTKYV